MEENKIKKNDDKYFKTAIYGAAGGVVAKTIIAPIERIKIIFQTNKTKLSWSNFLYQIKDITQKEGGFHKLWKGTTMQLVRIVPTSSITFSLQKYFKSKLSDNKGNLTTLNGYIVGLLTGVSRSILLYPLDTAISCISTDISKTNTKEIIMKRIRTNGIQSFYNGFTVSTIGMMPYSSLVWGTYYYLNNVFTKYFYSSKESEITKPISVYISTCFAQTVVYPLDVWRKRIQIYNNTNNESLLEQKKLPMKVQIDIFKNMVKERALFKGLSLNIFKTPIVYTIAFGVFSFLDNNF
jgi:hypothetical protein